MRHLQGCFVIPVALTPLCSDNLCVCACVQMWQRCAESRGGGQSSSCSDSWTWPWAKRSLTQSEDLGDTAWILHHLLQKRVAAVQIQRSPYPSAAQRAGFKPGGVFVVLRRTTQWTTGHLPSRFQLILTAVIYVAANLPFLSSEVSSAISFSAWMNEVIKHSNYKSHWLPRIQGRVPSKHCCEACYPGDCPVQFKTALFWPSELVGGENTWDADLLPQSSKCIFLILQQGNAAVRQDWHAQIFFWEWLTSQWQVLGRCRWNRGVQDCSWEPEALLASCTISTAFSEPLVFSELSVKTWSISGSITPYQ